MRLTGLKPQGQYTVYVRNVCAARTLTDGSVISQITVNESAAGTAAAFKTLKAENLGHMPCYRIFHPNSEITVTGNAGNLDLSLLVYAGKFPAYESGDRMMRPLPLGDKKYFNYYDKDDKNYYEEPRLEYALSSNYDKPSC